MYPSFAVSIKINKMPKTRNKSACVCVCARVNDEDEAANEKEDRARYSLAMTTFTCCTRSVSTVAEDTLLRVRVSASAAVSLFLHSLVGRNLIRPKSYDQMKMNHTKKNNNAKNVSFFSVVFGSLCRVKRHGKRNE